MAAILASAVLEGILFGGEAGRCTAEQSALNARIEAQRTWEQAMGFSGTETKAERMRVCDEWLERERGNISIADWVDLEQGDGLGAFEIGNAPQSAFSYTVSICRIDTGEELYRSNLVEPGYCIPQMRLDEELPAGVYFCTVTFTAYLKDLSMAVLSLSRCWQQACCWLRRDSLRLG